MRMVAMILFIHGSPRSWLQRPTSALLLTTIAVVLWCDAVRQIREVKTRVRFSTELQRGIAELEQAAKAVAENRR